MRRQHLFLLAALSALCVTQWLGCGRRGPLRPQSVINPAPITDLKATITPQGVLLSWARPTTYLDGSRMSHLGGFEVERRSVDSAEPFRKIGTAAVTDRQRFRQSRRFEYLDREINGAPMYAYRVVSFTLDGYFSEPSNIATVDTRPSGESNAPLPTPPQ